MVVEKVINGVQFYTMIINKNCGKFQNIRYINKYFRYCAKKI